MREEAIFLLEEMLEIEVKFSFSLIVSLKLKNP
jgi:hypothetical protein